MKPCDRWGAEVAQTDGDTYPYPVSGPGWVCFHCGERFTTPGAAEDHFGESPEKTAACRIKVGEGRGLVMALRSEEREGQCWGRPAFETWKIPPDELVPFLWPCASMATLGT